MVYRGPSSGCQTCRRRKVKCDGNDPCRRCIRLGAACPGVPREQVQSPRTSLDLHSSGSTFPSSLSPGMIDVRNNDHTQTDGGSVVAQESRETRDRRLTRHQFVRTVSDSHLRVDPGEDGDTTLMLTPHPTISWKEVGIAKFLSFIRSDPGQTDPWSTMLVDSSNSVDSKCTYFDDALTAVSLQRLSKEPYLTGLQRQAAIFHGRALRHFGNALQDVVQASSDKSLMSVRLLIIYGFNAVFPAGDQSGIALGDRSRDGLSKHSHNLPIHSHSPHSSSQAHVKPASPPPDPDSSSAFTDVDPITHSDPAASSIAPHFDGLLYMLLIRGPKQLEKVSTCMLYHSIRDRVVLNHSKRCRALPVSRSQPQWRWFFESPIVSPAGALTNIAIDVPYLRCRALTLHRQKDASYCAGTTQVLKQDAYSILSNLQTWRSELPKEWREPRVVDADSLQLKLGVPCEFQSYGHIYPNPFVAMVIGRYQAYSILLLQVIATSIRAELESNDWADLDDQSYSAVPLVEEYENVVARQRDIVDDICAVVAVYNLEAEKVYELGKEIPPCGMQYGGHLIEAMLASRTVPSLPTHQLKFLGMKMGEFLGR